VFSVGSSSDGATLSGFSGLRVRTVSQAVVISILSNIQCVPCSPRNPAQRTGFLTPPIEEDDRAQRSSPAPNASDAG